MRILQFSFKYCSWEYAYFYRKNDLTKTWPKRRVKMQYSHENIAIFDWELQYSHGNIAILTALRPANDRLFTQKRSPKWTPKSLNLGVCFHYSFNYSSGPIFQRFCLPNGPKMVPEKQSVLRPLTLLKCSKYQQNLTFPDPGEGPFFRSTFGTPPEHAYVDFWQLLGSIWGPFRNTFPIPFSTSFSDPHKTLPKNLPALDPGAPRSSLPPNP